MCSLDPKQLSLKPAHRLPSQGPSASKKAPRHRKGQKFLLGPIPWDWLCKATPLPGKTLAIAIALWHLSGMAGRDSAVKLRQKTLRELGIKRTTGYRALKALESAGLVRVTRTSGRLPLVTILPIDDKNTE